MRGQDVHYRLAVEFLEAVNGAKRQLTLPDGSTIDVTVPPGTRDGQMLRLRGKGGAGIGGGPPGDALIEIEVTPHPLFTRKGDDIHLELPVTLTEAVLGGKISAPTPTGAVTMNVPKGSNTGTVLRLRGKGVAPRGRNAGGRVRHTQGGAARKARSGTGEIRPELGGPARPTIPAAGWRRRCSISQEFVLRVHIAPDIVETWVEEGWLRPQRTDQGPAFTEMDVSRAQLIRDLREDLGVNQRRRRDYS